MHFLMECPSQFRHPWSPWKKSFQKNTTAHPFWTFCGQVYYMLSSNLNLKTKKLFDVQKCIDKDPSNRSDCKQLLMHPFFKNFSYKYPKHQERSASLPSRVRANVIQHQNECCNLIFKFIDWLFTTSSKKYQQSRGCAKIIYRGHVSTFPQHYMTK